MSVIARHSSPAVDALMSAISRLSHEEKVELVDRVNVDIRDEEEVPQWHLDILNEREAMRLKGQDKPLPFKEGMSQLREKLRAKGIMVE